MSLQQRFARERHTEFVTVWLTPTQDLALERQAATHGGTRSGVIQRYLDNLAILQGAGAFTEQKEIAHGT